MYEDPNVWTAFKHLLRKSLPVGKATKLEHDSAKHVYLNVLTDFVEHFCQKLTNNLQK